MKQTKIGLVNHLALQIAQITDSGLYHGRMGVILALYCYGKANGNQAICDYASDILQMTADNYYDGDITLENGLSGLGLGYSLLYKAGMFKDDLNELLFDIDKKIMSVDPRRSDDFSFKKGALGILYYIKIRLSIDQTCDSLHKDYIKELEENVKKNTCKDALQIQLTDSLQQPKWKEEEYLEKEIGIDNGSGYYLIKNSYGKIFSR